jgi:hypothetical protein
MTLFVGGRWRGEPSWIDRLGRAMGLYWIVSAFGLWVAFFLADTASGPPFRIRLISPTLAAAIGQKTLHVATVLMPLVGMVTLALLPIRLIGPRPRFRRMARRPGLVASCASGAALALIGFQVVLMVLAAVFLADDGVSWQEISSIPAWLLDEEMVTGVTRCAGFVVLVSWMTLFIGRQWRAEPEWTDRLGRAMGSCWIMAAFAVAIGDVLIQTDYLRHSRFHPANSPSVFGTKLTAVAPEPRRHGPGPPTTVNEAFRAQRVNHESPVALITGRRKPGSQ